MPWVCLQFVIVAFPDHTHLLFLKTSITLNERMTHSNGENGFYFQTECVHNTSPSVYEPRHVIPKTGILTSVVSDEPVQPPVKLRNPKCCSISSLTVIEYLSD